MDPTNESTQVTTAPYNELIGPEVARRPLTSFNGLQDLDPEVVVERLFDHVHHLVGVDAGIVFSRDGVEDLAVRWSHEVDGRLLSELLAVHPQGPALVKSCAARHETQVWPSPGSSNPDKWLEGLAWRLAVAVPLLDQGKSMGVFLAGWLTPTRLNPEGLSIIEASAAHTASALQRARLFQEVKREEIRLRGLLDVLPVPALLINRDTQMVLWLNEQASLLLGNIQGESYHSVANRLIVHAGPLDPPTIPLNVRIYDIGRIQIRAADGSVRTVEPTAAAISRTESLIVLHDITVDIRVDQTRARFLRMLSHHWRTPLTPLLGYTALLAEHAPTLDDPLTKEATSAMRQILDGMLTQVERLEQAASLRVGGPGSRRRISPKDLIMTAWNRPETDLVITGDHSTDLTCSVDHVIAALKEILDNALNHGIPPVTVSVSRQHDKTQIRISDNGVGIPTEWAEGIFTPYVTATDGYEAGPTGHIGLGLTLARLHVEAAAGILSYDSSLQAFEITL